MARAKPRPKLEPDAAERRAIAAAAERNRARVAPVQSKVPQPGMIDPVHSDEAGWIERLQDTFGSMSPEFVARCSADLAQVKLTDPNAATDFNAGVAFVAAIKPIDEMEAALAVQMWATHLAAMQAARRLATADTIPLANLGGNLTTKLMRTFSMQVEALSRLRRGGEQVVRHVHVDNRGGQAVIAETFQTGGAPDENRTGQPYEPGSAFAGSAALPGPDALGWGVPLPGNAERAVSHSRRAVAGGAAREPECVEARSAQRGGGVRAAGDA